MDNVSRLEQDHFTVSYRLDFWTHFRASRAVTNRILGTKLCYVFFIGTPAAILIVALWKGYNLSVPGLYGLPRWAALLGGPAFMFIFMPLLLMQAVWNARRKNKTSQGVLVASLTSDGFETSGNTFELKLKWGAIVKVLETKSFILIYLSSRNAQFIPKAAVSSAQDLATIRSIFSKHMGTKAKLFPSSVKA